LQGSSLAADRDAAPYCAGAIAIELKTPIIGRVRLLGSLFPVSRFRAATHVIPAGQLILDDDLARHIIREPPTRHAFQRAGSTD
jgi:hypothetical protein